MDKMLVTHRATNAPYTKVGFSKQKTTFFAKPCSLGPMMVGTDFGPCPVNNLGGYKFKQMENVRFC